jgi:phage-related baseplate assembly protein
LVDGIVRVTVLASTGVPSAGLLAQVLAAYDPDSNMPENDAVDVVAATAVEFDLVLSVTLYRPQAPRTPAQAIEDVATQSRSYVLARCARLEYQIVPNRIESVAISSVAEVYDCTVTSEIPLIGSGQFASLRSLTVNLAGFTEEPLP